MSTETAHPRVVPPAALSTPALVVDLDVFEANVAAMAELLRGTGKTVRPHAKTHRTPELARRQLGGQVIGATCATVGEAEAMVAGGIDDVLVANEVVDESKLARLAALARTARVAVAVDDPEAVGPLARQVERAGATVEVLIDVDVLLHRCGVADANEALVVARAVAREPALRLRGLMGYEGRIRRDVPDRASVISGAYAVLATIRDALLASSFPVEVVSAAGTSTLREALADPTITEIQAGVYAVMEPELLNLDLPFRCAVAVRGTVISRHGDRFVLDVGRRAVGMEYGPPQPIGLHATDIAVSDEHTRITTTDALPALGTHVDMIPGQIRTTFNLHDWVWATRGGQVVDCLPVSARGSSQ